MANHPPPPTEADRDDRGNLKVSKAVAQRFAESARSFNHTHTEHLERLLANAAGDPIGARKGSLGDILSKLDQIEQRNGVLGEAAVELCAQLCALSARLDDGGAEVIERLKSGMKGGSHE